jgi:hypothetical protein
VWKARLLKEVLAKARRIELDTPELEMMRRRE